GPRLDHGRRLVDGPLRRRAARRPGETARARLLLGPFRPRRQRLRTPDREHRRRRRPQPQGTPALEDYGVVPVPAQPGHWARAFRKETRADLKPLEVTQPEGPSFEVR